MAEQRVAPGEDEPAGTGQGPPTKSAAKKSPAKRTAAKRGAAEAAPAKAAPAKAAPAKAAPAKAAPAKKSPAKRSAGKRSATEAAPAKRTPATEVRSPEVRSPEVRSNEGPTNEAPAKESPARSADEAPVQPRVPVPAGPHPAAPGVWAAAVWEAVRHPDQPPQRLAALAVADLGPRAAAWVGWLRETYPTAAADGIARLAARQAGRLGGALGAVEAGGPVTAPIHLPAAAWVRATLVLRIAAAYGHDPVDQERAVELLDLLGLNPDQPGGGASPAALGRFAKSVGLTRLVGARFGRGRAPVRAVLRALAAVSSQADSIERLAHRAAHRYRTPKAAS